MTQDPHPAPVGAHDILARWGRLGVRANGMEEVFLRSRGPGGQRTDTVSTCVVLRHRLSGIEVRCQQERSQARNRWLARLMLAARLAEGAQRVRLAQAKQAAVRRRQTSRRPGWADEQRLAEKRGRSEQKTLRRRLHAIE